MIPSIRDLPIHCIEKLKVPTFRETLSTQRWDDHRYYHHSRINQSLHLVSATSFLCAYVMLFFNPPLAAIIAWCVAMVARQAGHFFFEPRGYDHVNEATDDYKETIKVGYNIRRKIVLMSAWGGRPQLLWANPSIFGLIEPATSLGEFIDDVGTSWLALGLAGLIFRMSQLWLRDGAMTSLAWACKIITDPFHDIKLYHKAPIYLMRGQLIDPMSDVHQR
jgi:hypothetical protein